MVGTATFNDIFPGEGQRYAELIDAMGVAVYTTDAHGVITSYNEAAADLWGRRPEIGVDLWCGSWRIFRPDGTLLPHEDCPMGIALKGDRAVRGEEAIAERPDGSRVWFLPYPTPLHDDSGRLVGGVNVLVDITDRKQAEFAGFRLGAIVDSSDDAIVAKDLDGIITSWNPGAERIFGYTAGEAVGRSIRLIIPDERQSEEDEVLRKVRSGERVEHFETVRRRKDGTLVDISLSVSPVKDGSGVIIGASKIARDITERKQAEQALQAAREGLAAELAATQVLHETSARLIQEDNVEALYERILDAAIAIMHSDFASIQMLYPERGPAGELRLLGNRGFNPEAIKFWEWVRPASESTCGMALRTGQRSIVADVETCDWMAGSEDLEAYLQTGIHAVQTTPLLSRTGKMVGMISTHWRHPHQPSDQELRLLDVLARQAADLIERSHAEQALRESEDQLRDFFDNSAVPLHWAGPDGTILRANAAELAMLGYTAEEYIGRDIRDFHRDRAAIEDILSRLKAGETIGGYPATLVHKDGSTRDVLIDSSVLWRDGAFIHARCITRDVTESKQADEALRESEERFRTLADGSPALIWVNGLEGAEFVNRTYLDFLGVDPSDVQGYNWAQFVHPEDRDRYLASYQDATAGRKVFEAEFRFLRRDGEYRWMRSVGHPRIGPGWQFLGYAGLTLDVTERKLADDQLAAAASLKDEFLGLVSHELRTPITTVLGNAFLLQRRSESLDEESRKQALGDITSEAQRLNDVIENLLLLTRLDASAGPEFQPVLLQHVVQEAVESFSSRNPTRTVRVSAESGLATVNGEEALLAMVVENLVGNADKYSPSEATINVVIGTNDAGETQVCVRDYGIGIEESELQQLFTPFFRSPTAREHASGMGLGLAVCKRIVDAHGGRIWATRKEEGGGTEFCFALPPYQP